MLYSGDVGLFMPCSGLPKSSQEKVSDKNNHLVLFHKLKKGDILGEETALNDVPNKLSVEVISETATIYSIHRSQFLKYFGGLEGEPAAQLRANILLRNNWINMKLSCISRMSTSQLKNLTWKEEGGQKGTKSTVKEIPFMKNNKRAD